MEPKARKAGDQEANAGRPTADAARPAHVSISRPRIAIAVAIVVALIALYWILSGTGALSVLMDEEKLRAKVAEFGIFGPLAIVLLMITAIVLSPIPSAPIAVAAGAAYGKLWGTLYVLIGAEAGALAAFMIARFIGFEAVQRSSVGRWLVGQPRSQNVLTAIVFLTRLAPFISFDVVSYAAGLTPLRLWRFAGATLAGIVPVSFALTYLGSEMLAADTSRIMLAVLLLGGITLVPLGAKLLWSWYRSR